MKIRRWFQESIALLNWIEGITHIVVSGIGFWGCISIRVFDIRVMTPIVENLIFGVFSIVTGIVMLSMIKDKKRTRKDSNK